MNQNILKGNWDIIKGKVKQQWGKLTDDDISAVEGNYDELVGRIKKTYGYQEEMTKKQVNDFINKNCQDTNQNTRMQ